MKVAIIIADCMGMDACPPLEDAFLFMNHWSLHGYTGPSMLNVFFSRRDIGTRPGPKGKSWSVWGCRYPHEKRRSFLLEFADSLFISQNPWLHHKGGYGKAAQTFFYMRRRLQHHKNEDLYTGEDAIKRSEEWLDHVGRQPAVVMIHMIETHSAVFAEHGTRRQAAEHTLALVRRLRKRCDLLFLLADHGDSWNARRKRWRHERSATREKNPEQFYVPFAVIGARRTGKCGKETSHLDVAPTVLGACGVPIPSDYEGVDRSGLFT